MSEQFPPVAVVGCGYWGRNLVRNFSELGALHAIVDADPATAEKLSRQYDVPARSFEDVLKDDRIAAIATASPAPLHCKIAIEAMEAGKDVFVEKPIALTMADGERMRETSLRTDAVLMVGHLLHYHPAYVKMRKMIEEGSIGKLRYIHSNRLSLGKLRTEEDVSWSFAPHDISMILGLANQRPVKIVSHKGSIVSPDLADSALLHMTFPSDLNAHVFVSWVSPFKEQRLVATGEKGSLVFDDTRKWGEKLTFAPYSIQDGPALAAGETVFVDVAEAQPLREECLHFLHCVKNRARPRTDADEALAVLQVLTAADQGTASIRSAA